MPKARPGVCVSMVWGGGGKNDIANHELEEWGSIPPTTVKREEEGSFQQFHT